MNLCTLFDSNYIDRALVTYDSLISACTDVTLYVIAFDRACFDTLNDLALPGMIVIAYEAFEDDTLRTAKKNRSAREFLWTCSGYCIRYVMDRFDLPDVTYIDSDLFFYNSPEHALQRFLDSNCDAAIISHRYSRHPENEYNAKMYGKYCVQFNSFKNTENGKKILDWWIDRCIKCCAETARDGLFGDQKYLDMFADMFDGVYEYEDFGMGIAPWNVDDYRLLKNGSTVQTIENRHTLESGSIIFYHFHSLDIFPDGGSNIRVFIRPGKHDRELVESLYRPYISKINTKRQFLYERFSLFDPDKQEKGQKLHEGELKTFLTCEPNLYFLVRKIWRYLLNKNKDYINI